MAELRQYPGERLVARLSARGQRRLRVGVSSAFFARFGLDDPWDFEAEPWAWGSPVWRLGGRGGRPRGVLGSFWRIFDRCFLGHFFSGVLCRGGLGRSLHHPWADWLPWLDPAAMGGLWRDRNLGLLGRLPDSGFGRPRSPWGPFATPGLVFLLPELEELEPEQPYRARRYRRRPRRARRVSSVSLPSSAPIRRPVDTPAAVASPRRRGITPPRPSFVEPLPAPLPDLTSVPAPRARRRVAQPGPTGLARVLARQDAPSVGSPVLRRALATTAPQSEPLHHRAHAAPSLARLVTSAAPTAIAPPPLQAPLSWAETRLQQASLEPAPGSRVRPVAAAIGGPPRASRSLFPVLYRSPSLAFLVPEEPEQEPEAGEAPRLRAHRRGAAPSRRARREPSRAVQALPTLRPTSQPPTTVSAPRRQAPATQRIARRLEALRPTVAPSADHAYASLRRVVRPDASPALAVQPVLRALARAPAPAVRSHGDPQAKPSTAARPRSLDKLLTRPFESPGLPGRLQALEAAPADAARLSTPLRRAAQPAAVLRARHPASPFRASSPMLAFLDILEDVQEEEQTVRTRPAVRRTSRRVRSTAPDATLPSAQLPDAEPVPEHPSVPSPQQRFRPVERPVRQAAARALLRAASPSDSGSVLPRPVVRDLPGRQFAPLSSTAFPGRARVARSRTFASSPREAWSGATRAMRVPWLPVERFVQPQVEPDTEQQPELHRTRSEPRRRPARVADGTARRTGPQPAPTARPVQPVAPRPQALPPTARAVARLAEVQPLPPRVAPTRAVAAAEHPAPRPLPAFVRASTDLPERASAPAEVPLSRARRPQVEARAPTPRASGTERAMDRLETTRTVRSGVAATAPDVSAAPSRQLWRYVRAPSTVWLQWREAADEILDTPSPATGFADLSDPGAPPRLVPRLAAGRVHPSGRVLQRLSGRARPLQRALALTGAPAVSGVPPTASMLEAGAVVDAERPVRSRREPAAHPGRPTVGASQRRRAVKPEALPESVKLSAIDALLAGGTSARALLPALARVERPEDVLRIVLERTLGWRGRGALPAPVRRLVEQVGAASGESDGPTSLRGARADSPQRKGLRSRRPRPSRRRPVSTPLTPAAPTVHHVHANYRIVGLVQKLEQLIHLVDVEHRLASARSQVRMAEDSPAARQPGTPDASAEAGADAAAQSVDALVKTIVEFVSEELAMLAMRRPEDTADRSAWF